MVLGWIFLTGALVVREQLLDERTYHDALARSDAYRRTYSEVLVDPAVVEASERLLGRFRLEGVEPGDARVLVTNALHWAVPPSVLRRGTERFVTEALAYVRGDVERIDADVDLRPVVGRLEDAVTGHASAALALARERVVESLEEYASEVDEVVAAVADGRIPAGLPVPADGLDDDAVAAVLDRVAAATGADRVTVAALVAGGSDRDALVSALADGLDERVRRTERDLQARLEDGRAFDPMAELAEREAGRASRVVEELDAVRDLARLLRTPTLVLGAALTVAGVAGVVALHRRDLRRAWRVLGVGWLAAGLATVVAWYGVRTLVASPLDAATATGSGTWNLPEALRAVVVDVEADLASTLAGAVVRLALVAVVLGLVFLAGGAVAASVATPVGRRRRVPLTVAAAMVAAGAAWIVGPTTEKTDTCNGHVELCDRPYDQVVQAATHNSMSSPDVVKVWPEHDETIREQLDAGIRALLIDTHYWNEVASAEQLRSLDPAIPPAVVDAALSRQEAFLAGRPGAYLCHSHCIWGAVPVVDALEDVRGFLDDNPREVVTLIVQDAISTADTEEAFDRAGLDQHLFALDEGAGWPTLGELIDGGRRLVVFAEEGGPPPPWYHPAFEEHIQDTPFRFRSVEDFSCEPYRGPAEAPLFLMNHWLQAVAPDRRNAAVANERDVIVGRARECAAERGQLPDFVAVDFSGIGDVLASVDELNGVTSR